MYTNRKRQQLMPFLLLSFVLLISLAVFTVIKMVDLTELSSAIGDEEQLYERNEDELARLELLSMMEDDLRQSYQKLDNMIPEQAEQDKLIHYINKLSIAAGLNLEKIEFDERVVNNNLNEIPFTLSFNGSYPKLISLLKNLAAGKRFIRIDEINIVREDAAVNGITINMKANAFYR